jgi:hypothetical protein
MIPSFTQHSQSLQTSPYRFLPGILTGGSTASTASTIQTVPLQDLKQPTPAEEKTYPLLSLPVIHRFLPLAEYYGISEKARGKKQPTTSDYGFLPVYEAVGKKGLARVPAKVSVGKGGISMARKRIVALKSKMGQMKSMKLPLFHTDGQLKGLPTKMHTILIMWGYSPEPARVKKIRNLPALQ